MNKIKYEIPERINYQLIALIIAANIFQFLILPLLLLKSAAWALSIIILAPLNNTMWYLIHEGIHKNLMADTEANEFWSRTLSVMFGASFQLLLFAHMMHHKYNRDWESEYVAIKNLREKFKYYFNLFFGVYLMEIASSFMLALLPRKMVLKICRKKRKGEEFISITDNFFYGRDRIEKVREEMLLVIAFFGLAIVLYGKFLYVLAAVLIIRAMTISLMDNIFHYGTPIDNSNPGKLVRANKITRMIMLNANYHGLHHAEPKIPWNSLPAASQDKNLQFVENFSESMAEQFNGAIINQYL